MRYRCQCVRGSLIPTNTHIVRITYAHLCAVITFFFVFSFLFFTCFSYKQRVCVCWCVRFYKYFLQLEICFWRVFALSQRCMHMSKACQVLLSIKCFCQSTPTPKLQDAGRSIISCHSSCSTCQRRQQFSRTHTLYWGLLATICRCISHAPAACCTQHISCCLKNYKNSHFFPQLMLYGNNEA